MQWAAAQRGSRCLFLHYHVVFSNVNPLSGLPPLLLPLLQGRSTYSAKLDLEAESIEFAPGGDSYLLLTASKVGLEAW